MMRSKVSGLTICELPGSFRTADQYHRTRRNRIGIIAGPNPVCRISRVIFPQLHGDYRQAGGDGLKTCYSGHGTYICRHVEIGDGERQLDFPDQSRT